MGGKSNDNDSLGVKMLLQYKQNPSQELRNDIVMEFMYIPKVVATQMISYTTQFAQLEDIVNEGVITLIECIDKFEFNKGVSFEAFAYAKIKYANIDYIRRQDWVPRRARKTSKDINRAYNELAMELKREPTVEEIASYIGISESAVKKNNREIANSIMVSFEEILDSSMTGLADSLATPEDILFSNELKEQLKGAIDSLNEKERTVISLYYYEHLRLAEIADIMELSESRVCQIHKRAIDKMKKILDIYMKG